jgi:hypothetical protein
MPQFRVVKDGRRTTGDRGDWGVVYTPLGIFLHNEVEEIPDPVPEPDSTGSTTPDPEPAPDSTGSTTLDGGEAPPDSTGSTTPDPEPAPEPDSGVGFEDPEPKPKRRSPK